MTSVSIEEVRVESEVGALFGGVCVGEAREIFEVVFHGLFDLVHHEAGFFSGFTKNGDGYLLEFGVGWDEVFDSVVDVWA